MRGLSTKILSPDQQALANRLGLALDEKAFIRIQSTLESLLDKRGKPVSALLNSTADAWLSSSKNALPALAAIVPHMPPRPIAVVGSKTALLVEKLGISPLLVAPDAQSLGQRILSETTWQRIHFFCGNLRRATLPDLLRAAGRNLQEWTVYETRLTSHRLAESYGYVLFFSPSGVASFFQQNDWDARQQAIAIGPTTASAFEAISKQTALVADTPSVEAVLQQAALLFSPTH